MLKKDKDGFYKDISGFSYVVSYQTTNKYLRFLLNEGVATAIDECFWLNKLQNNIPFIDCMTHNEYVAKKQCEFLNKKLGDIFTTYSMRD